MRPQSEIHARLRALGAATLHEVTGPDSACDPGLRPVWEGSAMSGPAFTVRGWPGDNLAIHRALGRVEAGDVLVIDVGGHIGGYWGEVLTVAAMAREVAGLVIDGGVRDVGAIRGHGFPVFARGVALTGTGKFHPGTLGAPVTVGDVTIAPGDIVVGDDDGVVVIPADELNATLEKGNERSEREARMMERLRDGATTVELLGLEDRIG